MNLYNRFIYPLIKYSTVVIDAYVSSVIFCFSVVYLTRCIEVSLSKTAHYWTANSDLLTPKQEQTKGCITILPDNVYGVMPLTFSIHEEHCKKSRFVWSRPVILYLELMYEWLELLSNNFHAQLS